MFHRCRMLLYAVLVAIASLFFVCIVIQTYNYRAKSHTRSEYALKGRVLPHDKGLCLVVE